MKEQNNKKILFVISTVIAVVLVIGITYAAFHFIGAGGKQNVLTLGKLQLILEEENEISLIDEMPVSDEDGLASEGYRFTLKNNGSFPISYSIYLDDIEIETGEEALDTSFLKYSLDYNGTSGIAEYLDEMGTSGNRVITSGTIEKNVTNTYVLRVWITGDKNGDIQRQVWKGRIRLEGTQTQ